MGKLSHKIWVKVICLLIIAIFLFNQTAYARHYTANESMKEFFKSDADQAAMYVVGVALSIAIPVAGQALDLVTLTATNIIIGGAVNVGSQIAVACGADPTTTMIVGGAVGGLASAGTNVYNGLQSGAFAVKDAATGAITGTNYALIAETIVIPTLTWTASATASALVGKKNPILGSFAGMATGVAVSSGLTAIAPGDLSARGGLIPKEQADLLKNSTIPTDKYGNAEITTAGGQKYFLNLDANNNIVIKGPGTDGATVTAIYAEPGTSIHTPTGPLVEVTGVLGKDGRPIAPENSEYIESKLVFYEDFTNKVSPQLLNQAVQVSRITNIYGPLPTDVARIPLSYYGEKYGTVGGFFVGAIKGLQNLGPGILAQTAVQYALYEALGKKNRKSPWAQPLLTITGNLTSVLVNEALGKQYAGLFNSEIKYNPWSNRPQDLNFGAYFGRLFILEAVKAGINTGFNYLDTSIKSNTFPGMTSLGLSMGKFFSGILAASLVDMALPTKTDVAIKNDIYKIDKDYLKGTELEEIRPHTFAETFSQGLKTNFREVLFNTFPIYIPSVTTGVSAIPTYVKYIQDQLTFSIGRFEDLQKGYERSQESGFPQQPYSIFYSVFSSFGNSLSGQAVNALSYASADVISNSFMPASYKTYMAAFKFKDTAKPIVASYHMQVPEEAYLTRLEKETRLTQTQLGEYIEVSKQSVSKAPEPETLSPADQYVLDKYKEGVIRTGKLYDAGKLIAKLGVYSEPVVITLDLTDLAGIPLTKLSFKQERTFDILQDRLLELMNKFPGGIRPIIFKPDPDKPDVLGKAATGIIREHIESDAGVLGIAGYTRDLRLSAVTPMDRWGRDLRTVYYGMDSQGNQELKPEKITLYYYGPFGRILSSTFNMDEKKFKDIIQHTFAFASSYNPLDALKYKLDGIKDFPVKGPIEGIIYHDLSLYTRGRIDRTKPLLSLDVTEITKGPALRIAANIPEVLNKIEAAKMGLSKLDAFRTTLETVPEDFKFDEQKFNTLISLVEGTLDPKIADVKLADVFKALNKLAQEKIEDKTKGITAEDAGYFVSGLSYLINENKPLPIRLEGIVKQIQDLRKGEIPIKEYLPTIDLPETYKLNQLTDLISSLKEFGGRFKINEAYRDLDMTREVTFNYIMEVVPQKGRFERLPAFTFISGFEGPKSTFLLTANYDYTRDPTSLTDENSWAMRALEWFRNQGKDLKGVQVNIAGRDLWFLQKEGSDRLYPAGYGPYYYSGAGDIPKDIRDILTGVDWGYKDYLGTTTVGAGNPLVNTGSKSEIK